MPAKKLKIGVVGCGAIGSRIAYSVKKELKNCCQLTGIYDIDIRKVEELQKKLKLKNIAKSSLEELIRNCDCMIEAVNAKNTKTIIKKALMSKKSVLAMSVGKLLNAADLFRLAQKNHTHLLIPSGAIAGIDAIKAASLKTVKKLTLTTRKPPRGLKDNPYLVQKGFDLENIKKETVLFDGNANEAVKCFPQNINVAATLAMASHLKTKLRIRILTSPRYKTNSHEIEMAGDFGTLITRTENVPCPDNPKTSYLAVLSGIQTLKQYCLGLSIGT